MLARIFAVVASLVAMLILIGVVLILRAGSPSTAAFDVLTTVAGQPASADPHPVHFVVQPGDSATTVADNLQSAGLIHSALAFRLAARFSGVGARLEAGDYELRANMPLAQVLNTLAQGRMSGGLLTIPEGWRDQEIADALQRAHITTRAAFLRAADHPTASDLSGLAGLRPGASAEGFLFPDSYRFNPSTPADQIVHQMVQNFERHVTPDIVSAFRAQGLTLEQGVTLASIVEREAVVPSERPIIASVYLNRLRRGMRLQADPTVQFALIPQNQAASPLANYWKRPLTFADLRVQSPYNTYQVIGLPPGPICNPGLASLQAVAHPATTDYLYFVARPNGTHAFARTLQQHEQNVAKYEPHS